MAEDKIEKPEQQEQPADTSELKDTELDKVAGGGEPVGKRSPLKPAEPVG